MEMILRIHARKYPLMEPTDAVKLLYQNEFGGGHLIRDEEKCLSYLCREYESQIQTNEPLLEDIGNGLVRVNLRALDAHGYSPEQLGRDFIRSAAAHRGDLNSFLEKLELLRTLTGEGVFSFSLRELEDYLLPYREAGCPMVSHSETYRAAYAPAYRIVLKSHISSK